jgi:hypothetical protein
MSARSQAQAGSQLSPRTPLIEGGIEGGSTLIEGGIEGGSTLIEGGIEGEVVPLWRK